MIYYKSVLDRKSQERFPHLNPNEGFHGFDLSVNLRLPNDYSFLGRNLRLTSSQVESMVKDGEFIALGNWYRRESPSELSFTKSLSVRILLQTFSQSCS